MASTNQTTATVITTLRVSPTVASAVREIANREEERQSTVLRRLIRRGLELETEHRNAR